MSISTQSFTSLDPRSFQPRIGLGSAFTGMRFYSSGPITDGRLRDEAEQGVRISTQIDAMRGPFGPQLRGVFEAQLPRMNAGIQRRLRHQKTDQIVGEQMNPQFPLDHARCEAAQDFDAERGFDVAKIQLHIPALRVQLIERALSDLPLVQQRGDQDLAVDQHFPYRQFVGRFSVLLGRSSTRVGP